MMMCVAAVIDDVVVGFVVDGVVDERCGCRAVGVPDVVEVSVDGAAVDFAVVIYDATVVVEVCC